MNWIRNYSAIETIMTANAGPPVKYLGPNVPGPLFDPTRYKNGIRSNNEKLNESPCGSKSSSNCVDSELVGPKHQLPRPGSKTQTWERSANCCADQARRPPPPHLSEMVASLSKSLKLRHLLLLPYSRPLTSRLVAFSTSDASLSSSASLPQSTPPPSPSQSQGLSLSSSPCVWVCLSEIRFIYYVFWTVSLLICKSCVQLR